MNESIEKKILSLQEKYKELIQQISDPEVIADNQQFSTISREFSRVEKLLQAYSSYKKIIDDINDAKKLISDPEMQDIAKEEIEKLERILPEAEFTFHSLLIPPDPYDQANVFIEIRAAAGGDESAIFAGDLLRMYTKYADKIGSSYEIISSNSGSHGGYKEVVVRLFNAPELNAKLKFESGAHRVQRVPETEAQGRVHTSTCTVAVLPEIEDISEIEINTDELKIDTFRASGAGGQHVNKTESAIRITHLPSGIVVECQDGRSQHQNKAKAMTLLYAKLLDIKQKQQQKEQAQQRKSLVGTGDRSERIRTYNFPQGRMTDHRIALTLYSLTYIMEGDLDEIIHALQMADIANQMNQFLEV